MSAQPRRLQEVRPPQAPNPVPPGPGALFTVPQRLLWLGVCIAPAVAATLVAASAVLPGTVLGAPLMIAVVMGTVVCTLGFAALVVLLEHWFCGMPDTPVDDALLAELNAARRLGAAAVLRRKETGLEPLAHTRGGAVADQGLEGRQRFATQQLTPVAAYARTAPQPITEAGWKAVCLGNPDGMGYNGGVARGYPGDLGLFVGASVMDQMVILTASAQTDRPRWRNVPPGEVFFGPTLGAWSATLMAAAEVGYTERNGTLGLRGGCGGSLNRRDSIGLDLAAPLPPLGDDAALLPVGVTRERSRGLAGNVSLSWAKAAWGKWWLRGEAGRQEDVAVHQIVRHTVGQKIYAQENQPLVGWLRSLGRSWFDRHFGEACLDRQPRAVLGALGPDESVELMALGRDGGLLAVGAQGLRWGGLPAHALSAVLDAVGVFVGFGRLRHTSSLLKVRCVPNEGTGQSLKITLTQHRHVSCRAFGTMPGAIGYDRGNRDIDTHVYEATLPRQDRIVQHLLGLYDQVQQGSHDQQLQTFVALCAEAKAPYGQQTLVGGVVSQDVGVPVNLLPSELWSRWMPRGMALEAGWRAQSARVAHQSRLVAAATVEPKGTGPSAAVDDGGVRGFTVHHDQTRSLGPEGRRLCRIEGQVVQGPGGEPLVTLANHWSMDRANANEVGAFILSPLNTLVGTHEGPLWGAGWRTSREATLSGAFTVTQLRQVADRVLRHGAGQGADSRQNQALCQLAEAIEAAVAKADGQGGWDPPATDGPDAADPLNMLADAIDTWARRAHLWALPWLHGLLLELDEPSKRHRRQELLELQERGKAVPPQKPTEPEDKDALKPLHLATDSDAYALPARLVRQLHLTEFKNVQARQRAAELACKRIDTCRALLASDPLVGQAQRNELEASFTLAKGWAERLSQAV